ncbi:uncharacterized protein MYCFIDRAFT_174334 [Pseudocercospora fijiensis CIRAD86]|uniref:Uncharacterized protein n=1 Tax=Pseudocercospora fijiensis (strain CIRAD86) TaxID=383855 RepID=M2YYT8_PSEFD|nr:uncharacterized protein MYCFIDRAFT_174334 [Pseudocercospora fijiensis CIRAD86]EME82795.1 hypothetical protein MYCFIDRAFT_174334 [Pseudocercospora fijiensis CIRAD86]
MWSRFNAYMGIEYTSEQSPKYLWTARCQRTGNAGTSVRVNETATQTLWTIHPTTRRQFLLRTLSTCVKSTVRAEPVSAPLIPRDHDLNHSGRQVAPIPTTSRAWLQRGVAMTFSLSIILACSRERKRRHRRCVASRHTPGSVEPVNLVSKVIRSSELGDAM